MLKQRLNFLTPSNFALSGAGILGTTQKVALDRNWPIEEIVLVLGGTVGTAYTTVLVDGLLKLVKRVNLSINDGVQPRSVVDMSGVGLLEYASLAGLNLDRSTLGALALSQGSTIAISNVFRISYRIPLVHPSITEPLRTRMLLDVQNHPQDPILTVDFGASADVGATGVITPLICELILVRRHMDAKLNQDILKSGGYIPCDLMEQALTLPASTTNGEARAQIATPGQYLNLFFRQYLGGASVVARDVVDAVGTVGSETRWRLESGGSVLREWRWKHLQIINDFSRVANHVNQTYAPNFAGALAAATTLYQPASSTMLDFLTDGLNDANELGSLLDCNLPAQSGLKMELIGNYTTGATAGSAINFGGHRLFGDLSRWQALKAA